MTEIQVRRASRPLRGELRVPADKSITHRALMLAPLVRGETRIDNYLDSGTTRATLVSMRALGAEIQELDAHTLRVRGGGLYSLREPEEALDCRGSGTTMRLLAGLVAGQDFFTVLDGSPALRRRPMARIVEPLRRMGARVMARDGDRLPPLAIRGGGLRGIEYSLPVASAQVKSAVLLAGLYAGSPTLLHEPAASRDHTERMMRALGVTVDTAHSGVVRLEPAAGATGALLSPPSSPLAIPGDFSSAAFWLVAALLLAGSELCLSGVGLNPGRTGLLDALARMGAGIHADEEGERNGEPVGDLTVRSADGLYATDVGGDEIPRLIDELPILAVAATQAQGETRVRDASELRVKESDRITALAGELRKLGAQIEEQADGFVIAGSTLLRGARVRAHGDHRLAMSLAIAGLVASGETVIEGWDCVADSYPNFEQLLGQLAV
jgi:3-phosphoshikimate 1-carboxyvinyltransferase